MPDALDALPVKPVEPRVVPMRIRRRAVEARVFQPQLDVRSDIADLALHDPRITAGLGDPCAYSVLPRLV